MEPFHYYQKIELSGRYWLKYFFRTAVLFMLIFSALCQAQIFNITTSLYLGGSSSNEQVIGSAILSDGKLVLVANLDGAFNGGVTPILKEKSFSQKNYQCRILQLYR